MFYNRYNRKNCQKNSERITHKTRCRYCGEDVFYHKNEYDGRVFFQDLGGPWPKHFCKAFLNTDRAELYICGTGKRGIYWVKQGYEKWHQLNGLSEDIESLRHNGVYIIWYFDEHNTARTVKVGKGNLWERLEDDRRSPEVENYVHRDLHVTWALLPVGYIDSVAASLIEKLQPFVGKQRSGDTGIFVGLPPKLEWKY